MSVIDISKCLYLIRLNETSFANNPGKVILPKGCYIAEIRDGVFAYNMGYSADVEIMYNSNGHNKVIRLPEFGRFGSIEVAKNAYCGLTIEFCHDGGTVEVYNPKPAKFFIGKCSGECIVAIWNANDFGAPLSVDGFNNIEPYTPGNDKILIVSSNPYSNHYRMIGDNVVLQPHLSGLSKFGCVIFPPESYPLLYMVRDNECIERYLDTGGRVYIVGSAIQYLSFYNILPIKLPKYVGDGEYNTVAVLPGDTLTVTEMNVIKFSTTVTVPMINVSDEEQIVMLKNDKLHGWCAMKRKLIGNGKLVWSSYFISNYQHSERWNELVLKQINWLMQ